MRRFLVISLTAIFLAALFSGTQSVGAFFGFGGGVVYDAQRDVKSKLTTAEHIKQVANTATQIANQVTELASMSPESMMVHILGVEDKFGDMVDTIKQARGLMDSTQTAQEAWDSAFKKTDAFLDGKTTNIDDLTDNRKMVYTLDKTYRDSLTMAKAITDIEDDAKRLRKIMRHNQDTVGNKNAKQVVNQLQIEKIGQTLDKQQLFGVLTSTLIADIAKENQREAQDAKITFNSISLGISDPYNPTEQDRVNFERPVGRGFVRF